MGPTKNDKGDRSGGYLREAERQGSLSGFWEAVRERGPW